VNHSYAGYFRQAMILSGSTLAPWAVKGNRYTIDTSARVAVGLGCLSNEQDWSNVVRSNASRESLTQCLLRASNDDIATRIYNNVCFFVFKL
jgi:hypothetical protein